jgi:hypothetical protein
LNVAALEAENRERTTIILPNFYKDSPKFDLVKLDKTENRLIGETEP